MWRDITMIFSVLVSVVSLGFGVYKNIEAGNAQGFTYEQAYRIINVVNAANISTSAKASIIDAALGALGTPPPVVDLSRSSAGVVEPQVCSDALKSSCVALAEQLAAANTACMKSTGLPDACMQAQELKQTIDAQRCFICFAQ